MSKTDYEKGFDDGFCCLESRYPNNTNYMAGFRRGSISAEMEWRDSQESSAPYGVNDAHFDCFYA